MPSAFQQILAQLRAKANSTVAQGRYFERLVAFYLENDPVYKDKFAEVLSWAEWQKRRGEPANDVGIDLVAIENKGDEKSYWAIQAKFYADGTPINRKDIDSFFTASGKKPFTHRMFISTTDNWGKNAEAAINNQHISCIRRGLNDLANSPVPWENFLHPNRRPVSPPKFAPRPHQQEAIDAVCAGLQDADRGRLIMACGTGKTYTSLKIAERLAPHDGHILFLVPSLSLLSQSLREWSEKTDIPLRNFIVCSDLKAGHTDEDINIHDLALPATLKPQRLSKELCRPFHHEEKRLNVVFCTYHSIAVVAKAQKEYGAPDFDLVICDEAHRTTGVEGKGSEKKYFTAVHDANYLRAKKRLYMTATPRLYKSEVQAQAKEQDLELCSMDDTQKYGEELHRLGFSEAVSRGLLSDYKVLILATQTNAAATQMQNALAHNGELNLDDAARLIGCWNGLAKRRHPNDDSEFSDPIPMRRAVAFTQTIKYSQMACRNFNDIIQQYLAQEPADAATLICETDHVDGSMNALQRSHKLQWLKDDPHQSDPAQYPAAKNYCRILSNARCLSEGVDVPALDAVMFLNPRKSQVDVVQAVGRVMRKSEGKKEGYVILPIAVTADTEPDQALHNNQSYKVVWQVLQALRAHDENFNAVINKIDLNDSKPDKIQIIGVPYSGAGDDQTTATPPPNAPYLPFPNFDQWRDAIYARIVLKCGDRRYWETWAKDVATIAQTNITRIRALLAQSNANYRELFDEFLARLRQNLNPAVSEDDAIEMLSQHLITRPVFSALFADYAFADKNPVSKTMQDMLDLLDQNGLQKETEQLQKFYDSVKARARGIDNAAGKQRIMLELYEKFFATAFKKDAQRLGIVYTPVEVVDFILASADAALKQEFGKRLSHKNIHILDPFTGTGTFISRLLQSDLLATKNLPYKYAHELHANESALLAYYIAAINIEESYHHRCGGDYEPFNGIVLTDTFQMTEHSDDLLDDIFPINSARGKKQRDTPIRVIIGNPPYSAGQRSANDNNPNLPYPMLDERIKNTYVRLSSATNKNSLYDSYIRALRWSTDRIGDEGIIAFVTNGSFIDGGAARGLRKSLVNDFTAIYCLNLRGNQRTSGETSKREGGKIFGSGSRAPIAITLFVKKKDADNKPATVYYHDIGDYLTRAEKLEKLDGKNYADINWQIIKPDKVGDWINQRHPEFNNFLAMGKKGDEKISIFQSYSRGLATGRDAWLYNFGKDQITQNMTSTIDFYNAELARYKEARADGNTVKIREFVNHLPNKISWSSTLYSHIRRGITCEFNASNIRTALYRPFNKQHLYYGKTFIDRPAIAGRFFPTKENENIAILVSGIGSTTGFSALMTDIIPDLNLLEAGTQCFPLYRYDDESGGLGGGPQYTRRDNITDEILQKFRVHYGTAELSKEDLFYYVYGVLHSRSYKTRYQADLRKMLPRIPMAGTLADFMSFSVAGRKLGKLHIDYEQAEEYPLGVQWSEMFVDNYEVAKMRHLSASGQVDRSAIKYNDFLHLSGIPPLAYDYEVNGKTPIAWIMERYRRTTHKESGITNNPNDWSNDPQYILSLLKKAVTVGVESATIIGDLPNLPMGDE